MELSDSVGTAVLLRIYFFQNDAVMTPDVGAVIEYPVELPGTCRYSGQPACISSLRPLDAVVPLLLVLGIETLVVE